MSSNMQDANTQPEPAVGQVWQWRCGGSANGGPTVTIDRIDYGGMIYGTGRAFMDPKWLLDHYECIGVETPHGRVMVGERRGLAEPWTVTAVADGGIVFTADSGCVVGPFPAEDVAQWPLVTEPAPSPSQRTLDADLAQMEARLARAVSGPSTNREVDAAATAFLAFEAPALLAEVRRLRTKAAEWERAYDALGVRLEAAAKANATRAAEAMRERAAQAVSDPALYIDRGPRGCADNARAAVLALSTEPPK